MDSFSSPRLDVVLGSRREVLHLAPIIHEFRHKTNTQVRLISILTKQRDVLEALDSLSLQPDIQWNILGPERNSGAYFGEISILLSELWRTQKAEWLMSFGHSEIMVSAVVTAFQNQVPIAHLEDVNLAWTPLGKERHAQLAQKLVSILADLHFTPSVQSKNQLIHNGISENAIYSVGSTLADARGRLFENFSVTETLRNVALQRPTDVQAQLMSGQFFTIELKHPDCISRIAELLPLILERRPQLLPLLIAGFDQSAEEIDALLARIPSIVIKNPGHLQKCALFMRAQFILTDNDDTLEECAAYGSKCFLLHDQTMRIDLVSSGAVSMSCSKAENLLNQLKYLLSEGDGVNKKLQNSQSSLPPMSASMKVVEALTSQTGGNAQRARTRLQSQRAG